jgi:hypothetical protein
MKDLCAPEVRFVVSRAISTPNMADQVEEILQEAPSGDCRLLFTNGCTPLSKGESAYESSDIKAQAEMNQLTDEIEHLIQDLTYIDL